MVRWYFCFVLLAASAADETFAAPVAVLAALEGDVTVNRGGVSISSENIAEGFVLENFDTVATGRTGRADIRFPSATGVAGSARLDPGTSAYLDVSAFSREQTVGLELLGGGVTVQIASVFGRSRFEVRTDSGAYSQAGPGFRVVMAPSGETLVLARVGKVSCRVENRVVSAEPGTVVEVSATAKTVPVNVSTIDAYEAAWLLDKKQTLRDRVAPLFRLLGTRYQLQLSQFQRAWERQREASGPARAIQAATADLRRTAYPLERSLPRVQALRQLYEEGLIAPSFELTRGYAAKDFFKAWDRESADWANRLAQARGLYKNAVEAGGGQVPRPDLPAITYSSDFFR